MSATTTAHTISLLVMFCIRTNAYVLSNNSRGGLGEHPKDQTEQSVSRFSPLATEIVEGLLHFFAEAFAVGLWVEVKQLCV